ncbi:hypothetical protein [Maridesulfovibrio sp.]|uniref:hypothetical protein n=1 Tax=unclassified Maridesulfovibrio TaxID=2794999 RepID=UPI003AFF740E
MNEAASSKKWEPTSAPYSFQAEVSVTAIIRHFASWKFFISEAARFIGVGACAAVGIFFGFYPDRLAAALSPIDALRS